MPLSAHDSGRGAGMIPGVGVLERNGIGLSIREREGGERAGSGSLLVSSWNDGGACDGDGISDLEPESFLGIK